MKAIKLTLVGALASIFAITGCERNAHQDMTSTPNNPVVLSGSNEETGSSEAGKITPPATCNPNAYIIILESRTQVGANWEWIWSVQNSNPGNGTNGTFQDLSHWGMQFGTCFNTSSLVSAAYSGDGTTWTSFAPSYQTDPSLTCLSSPVLKFDFGTVGVAKSYYKLVISANHPIGVSPGYYKSGTGTGCCTISFSGISCEPPDDGGDR